MNFSLGDTITLREVSSWLALIIRCVHARGTRIRSRPRATQGFFHSFIVCVVNFDNIFKDSYYNIF